MVLVLSKFVLRNGARIVETTMGLVSKLGRNESIMEFSDGNCEDHLEYYWKYCRLKRLYVELPDSKESSLHKFLPVQALSSTSSYLIDRCSMQIVRIEVDTLLVTVWFYELYTTPTTYEITVPVPYVICVIVYQPQGL